MTTTSFYFPDLPTENERIKARHEVLKRLRASETGSLFQLPFDMEQVGSKNCENLIGSVAIPVGVAGPIPVRGDEFNPGTEVLLPLATTEGALVASANRGSKVLRESGGADIIVKKIGMSRAPVFRCSSGAAAVNFADWLSNSGQLQLIKQLTEATSSHLTFKNLTTYVRSRYVYARYVFDTDQAMGMNMVTIALQQALPSLLATYSQDKVELLSLSSNVCTDKKDSAINRIMGRGYWVQAEARLSAEVIRQVLKVEPQQLIEAHVVKNLIGSNVAGSLSQNMQAANLVAAMFLATGQDAAHIVEGAQASTSFEQIGADVYVAVTLPNLNIGVVGGGSWLPAQTQARKLILAEGELTAEQLAGVVGVAVLAGEISGLAALANHTLAAAHQKLGRHQLS